MESTCTAGAFLKPIDRRCDFAIYKTVYDHPGLFSGRAGAGNVASFAHSGLCLWPGAAADRLAGWPGEVREGEADRGFPGCGDAGAAGCPCGAGAGILGHYRPQCRRDPDNFRFYYRRDLRHQRSCYQVADERKGEEECLSF